MGSVVIIIEITVRNPTCSTQVSSTLLEEEARRWFLVSELNEHESQVPLEEGTFERGATASQILTVSKKAITIHMYENL